MQVMMYCRQLGARGATAGRKKRVQVGMCIFTNWVASSHCMKYLIGVQLVYCCST